MTDDKRCGPEVDETGAVYADWRPCSHCGEAYDAMADKCLAAAEERAVTARAEGAAQKDREWRERIQRKTERFESQASLELAEADTAHAEGWSDAARLHYTRAGHARSAAAALRELLAEERLHAIQVEGRR